MNYYKDIIVFGIESAKVLRKNLTANQSTIKNFLKAEQRSYRDNATNLYLFSHNIFDSILKRDENYYLQVFLKESIYIEKEKIVIRQILMT